MYPTLHAVTTGSRNERTSGASNHQDLGSKWKYDKYDDNPVERLNRIDDNRFRKRSLDEATGERSPALELTEGRKAFHFGTKNVEDRIP